MEKKGSATKGFAVLSAAGIASKLLSVLYVPLLLRIIGDVGYGIYLAGYQIYVFIYMLTNSGFPVAISKLQAELMAHENYKDASRSFKMTRTLLFLYGLFMTVMTLVLARPITNSLGSEGRAYLVVLALSPTMLFSAVSSSYRGYFNGNSYMKPTAISQVIEQFVNVTLSLVFAFLLKPISIEAACAGATIGTTIGSLGSAIYLSWSYKSFRIENYRRTPDYVKRLKGKVLLSRLLSYAVPIAINVLAIFGGNLVDLWNTMQRLVVAGFSESDAYMKYGVLGKYNQLVDVPMAITAALYTAIIPSISRAIELKDGKLLKEYINEAFRTSLLITVPAAAGLAVLSRPIFLVAFSQKYVDGWYLMAAGSWLIVLTGIVQIQSGILQSLNKTKLATISMLAGVALKIVVNYFLTAIPSINITGAVIGTIACYILVVYMNFRYIKKYVRVRISIKKQLKRTIFSSLIMAAAAGIVYKLMFLLFTLLLSSYISTALSMVISIIAGVTVYGLVMIKFGWLTEEDIYALPAGGRIIKLLPKKIVGNIKAR